MFGLGPMELVIVLVIVVIIFGVGKLPQVGKALGTAISEFRSTVKTPEKFIDNADDSKNDQEPKA